MDFWSVAIAVVVGLAMGLFIVSRKNIDYSSIHVINKLDFKNNMRKGQLIDVRKKDDFNQNKIIGAHNFTSRQIFAKYSKIRKDLSIYIYCNNGKKSYRIAKKLTKSGYRNIYILENGFNAY